MNDLSLSFSEAEDRIVINPIPRSAIFILLSLFLFGFAFSIFILALLHNFVFFLSFLFLSSIVTALLLWNIISSSRNSPLLLFLHSSPNSDLTLALHGHLVKITGPVSCTDVCLETSYEKLGRCVYTSTLLYEYHGFGLNPKSSCFSWRLSYSERFPTDFYICDGKSGFRILVKAGKGRKLIPLIKESMLVNTRRNRILSPNLIKWLKDRNLSAASRLIRLEEGYIKEGDVVSVVGMLCRGNDDMLTIVEPPEIISTGCQWRRLLLPAHFHGILLGTLQS